MNINKTKFNNCFLIAAATALAISCQTKPTEPPKENPYAKADLEVHVFKNDTTTDASLGGYGYNIYMYKAMYVHQPHIPAVNGNRGFRSSSDAEKTANLTIYKIRNNIMPPSLSVKELDSLGVLDSLGY